MPQITQQHWEQPEPSPDGAIVNTPSGWLIDKDGNRFSLVRSADRGMQIRINAFVDQITANVRAIMTDQGRCYQTNAAGDWYGYTGTPGGWQQVARPTPPDPGPPVTEGVYTVRNGRIVDPNGNAVHLRGPTLRFMNWPDNQNSIAHNVISDLGRCTPLLSSFPGSNLVRFDAFESMAQIGAANFDAICPYLDSIIAQGCNIEFECHVFPTVLSGNDLDRVCDWYRQFARHYRDCPQMMWGTQNEPGGNPGNEIRRIYEAIRSEGNENLIFMCINGGWTWDQMNPADYRDLRNVAWDFHLYGWESGYSTDQATVDRHLQGMIDQGRSYTCADGPIESACLEFSPCGYQNSNSYFNGQCWCDPNGQQVINAVFRNTQLLGWAGWYWNESHTTSDNGIGHLIDAPSLDGSVLTEDWGVQCRDAIAAGAPY